MYLLSLLLKYISCMELILFDKIMHDSSVTHVIMPFKYISTSDSVVICSKIYTFIFRQYFRYTEVLIYRKKVLLIPPNPR